MLTLEAIRGKAIPVAGKYGVASLELFGSYADGTANEPSDADFLVRFTAPVPSIFKVMGLRDELSRSPGLPVDVVILPLVRPDRLRAPRTEKIL
ncbi:MAG: nucleotidyltransferase domain-containing protein [Acidaminococcales bacterium]|nr:nucleotidyltransferase domain-containing protein [Acidaminococcales bacterium]